MLFRSHRSALDALPKGHYLHLDHVRESDAAYDKVHGPRCNQCKLHFGFDVLVNCPEWRSSATPTPIGKDENGKWRSAGSDEYTSNLCGRLAHIVLDDEVMKSLTPTTPTEEPAGGGEQYVNEY